MRQGQLDKNKGYFASVAKDYDRLQPVLVGPSYDTSLTAVVDLIPHRSEDSFHFVELGCGTGTLTQRVLDSFPESRGLAIDSEAAMLAIARGKLQDYARKNRIELHEASIQTYSLPRSNVVMSSYVCHHVPPKNLEELLSRIVKALRPTGCFILLDAMTAGPLWGEQTRQQRIRIYREHVASAIKSGLATQAEIDARWEFKRKMKAQGKDVEYRHSAENLLKIMSEAGFEEVGLVWRMFSTTILVGFT